MSSELFTSWWQRIYDSWPYDERLMFTICTAVIGFGTFWVLNAITGIFYHFNLFPQYRIQGQKWPEPELVRDCIKHLLITQLIARPIGVYFVLWPVCHAAMPMSRDSPVPDTFTILLQLLFSMAVADTGFYWAHRLLHHRAIYKYIHKKHHMFKTTIGIASEYAHPVEDIFANLIPTLAGPIILGSHIVVFWLWIVIRLSETWDAHSGYDFPWSPWAKMPFGSGADRHDFHHSHNVGNFGGFTIFWDTVMGTDKDYLNWVAQKKAATKKLE